MLIPAPDLSFPPYFRLQNIVKTIMSIAFLHVLLGKLASSSDALAAARAVAALAVLAEQEEGSRRETFSFFLIIVLTSF